MADQELLYAISTMLDEKLDKRLEPIENEISGMKSEITGMKSEITGMKSEITGMKSEITGIKSEITGIKENMVTKEDLRKSENMILAQLDIVQEKANEKFRKLQFRVM